MDGLSDRLDPGKDRTSGAEWIGGSGDRPSNDDKIGAGPDRLIRGHDPLLIVEICPGRTNSGRENDKVGCIDGRADRCDLKGGGHHPVNTGTGGESSEAHDLVGNWKIDSVMFTRSP